MRIRIWMLALAPFALIGCADETPPPVTTTTVTREVTTTGPVVATEPVASDVYVTQAPRPCELKRKPSRLVQGISGRRVTGGGQEPVTFGFQAHGRDRPASLLCGCEGIGCIGPAAGFGFPVTGNKPDGLICIAPQ